MAQEQLSTAKLARDYWVMVKDGAVSPGSFDDRDVGPGDPDYDAYVAYIERMAVLDGLRIETWSYYHLVYCFVASAVLRPDGTRYDRQLLHQWRDGTAAQQMTEDWGDTIVRARSKARRRLSHALRT